MTADRQPPPTSPKRKAARPSVTAARSGPANASDGRPRSLDAASPDRDPAPDILPPQTTASTTPTTGARGGPHSQQEVLPMNAIPSFDASRFADASFGSASKVFSDAAENLQVLTDSLVTGIQGLERARAEVLATGVKALQQQATGVAALAKVTGPKEALELQQQFARQALDAHNATIQALSGLAAAWTDAFRPLKERYADIAHSATQR